MRKVTRWRRRRQKTAIHLKKTGQRRKRIRQKKGRNNTGTEGSQMTKKQFSDWAARDLIFMDGATGSNLMAAGMPQNASSELWMLDHPQPVQKLQSDYVKIGRASCRERGEIAVGAGGLEE